MKMSDEYYMMKAIELAKKGGGYVHPNPLVGCVIVKDGEIIAEGYHEYYGEAHAEVNAIRMLENKGFQEWDKVTMYVTLEPCSHFGKTPPCSDLIVRKGIKKVVVASVDVNPIVGGKGIEKLKKSGVEVKVNVLEKEAKELNKRFFTYHLKHRPYVILKWAESKDRFLSRKDFKSREENIISSAEALKIVHQWRSEEQSILVGFNTVVKDNPQLNVRYVEGKNPVKIILDKHLSLDVNKYNVFKGSERVVVFNTLKDEMQRNIEFRKIDWNNKVKDVLKCLYEMQVVSVMVEGGAITLQSFIDEGMYDEIRVIKSKKVLFREGIKAPVLPKYFEVQQKIELEDDEIVILK